jgi:TRAP-type C4-dicarboxylate transport system permease small subunit
MRRFVESLSKCHKAVLISLNYVSVLVIFVMALWVFCDVTGRYVFNHPIPGTTELVKCYIVAIVFLGIAYTMHQKRHIRTTLIIDRLSPAGRAWFEMLASSIGTVIFSALFYFSLQEAWAAWLVREFDGVQLKVPVYPARFVVVIGSGLLVIQGVLDFLSQVWVLKAQYRKEEQS